MSLASANSACFTFSLAQINISKSYKLSRFFAKITTQRDSTHLLRFNMQMRQKSKHEEPTQNPAVLHDDVFCILFSWQCLQMCPSSLLPLLRPILKMTHLFHSCWVDKRHGAKWWWHRGQLPRGFPPQVSTPAQANRDRWWTMPI